MRSYVLNRRAVSGKHTAGEEKKGLFLCGVGITTSHNYPGPKTPCVVSSTVLAVSFAMHTPDSEWVGGLMQRRFALREPVVRGWCQMFQRL